MSAKLILLVKAIFVLQFLNSIENSIAKEKSFATSINAMIQLLEIETKLIDCVEKYIVELQSKVNDLRNIIHELKEDNYGTYNKREEYLHNPLNSFRLIRRLYNDWPKIEFFLIKSVGEEQIIVLQTYKSLLPTETDLMEASSGIYRLQVVYDLTVDDLVKGVLNDSILRSIDAYSMGSYLFDKNLFSPAAYWLYVSIRNYEQNRTLNKILDFGYEKALKLFAEVLVKQNSHINTLDTYLHWSPKNDVQFPTITKNDAAKQNSTFVVRNYERGCRGHFFNRTSNLFCLYNTTVTSFLLIAPLKMEILNMDPYIVIYHDVISPQEIQHLQDLTKSYLTRAEVYDENFQGIVNQIRTSHAATFKGDNDQITSRIQRRIIDMTGFDVNDSEHLTIVNYGIGGHYEMHYDFFNLSGVSNITITSMSNLNGRQLKATGLMAEEGDRIATILFYLSDVEQGGATVFPNLKLAVLPRKGSALMWYNLNNRLEADAQTLHAACPVLKGSKWVCTKWIRAHYQMFRKPCYK